MHINQTVRESIIECVCSEGVARAHAPWHDMELRGNSAELVLPSTLRRVLRLELRPLDRKHVLSPLSHSVSLASLEQSESRTILIMRREPY